MSNVRQYNITVPDLAGSTDTTILNGITVTSVHFIKTGSAGGAGDTAQLLRRGGDPIADTPITTATSLNVADQTTVGPNGVLIDDATYVVGVADLLRITTANNTNNACQAIVTGIPNTN
jgi:hypothetical protein